MVAGQRVIGGLVDWMRGQATTYLLMCFSKEDLFPEDEDGDEEMGWLLYVAGFVLWICWILDFSAWFARATCRS